MLGLCTGASAFASFVYLSGARRDLHSFPTRRSSDLARLDPDDPLEVPDQHGERVRARSEEHTSELQSHVNLVCRLLLEKKKFSSIRLLQRLFVSSHLSEEIAVCCYCWRYCFCSSSCL